MFQVVSKTITNTTFTYFAFYMLNILIYKTSVYKVFGLNKLDIINILPNIGLNIS